MFQRLYELSRSLPERASWERLNEGMPANYDRGLAVCFDDRGEWIGVKTFKGNKGVVYRSGPSRGTDFTLCCKLAGDTANRLLKAAKNLAAYRDLPTDKKTWLEATIQCFEHSKDEWWREVETKVEQAAIDGKLHRGYIYWARESVSEPVYSWSESKEFMVWQFLKSLAKGGKRLGCCAACSRQDHEVCGNFSVVACYNLDKPGSIAGGFATSRAHRNLPICQDCAFALAEAFTFTKAYLTSQMAGQSYMILPYANNEPIRDELVHSLIEHPERYQLGQERDLVSEELELLREFRGCGDQLAFALIFFRAKYAAEWRIQAEVQQLLPSRMHALYDAAKKISQADDLATEDKKEGIKPLKISSQTFKIFSGTSASTSADTLRAWLVALFEHRPVDYQHFTRHLVSKLISTGKSKPDLLHWMTRQAWGLYRYAILTGFILPADMEEIKSMQEAIPDSAYGRYIQQHVDFFSRPEIITAFLTGCYASQVAKVQYEERKATPFTKKFIGRLLSRQQLQKLYREGHNKLAQYDKLSYVITSLDPDLAAAWVACGDSWAVSDEEATFAFTIGYSLAYRIRRIDIKNGNKELEE